VNNCQILTCTFLKTININYSIIFFEFCNSYTGHLFKFRFNREVQVRIAIVLNTSWNIYNFRMGLVNSFQRSGHEVFAIAPKDQYTLLLQESGCHYVELKMDSRGANPIKDAGLIVELFKIYKKIKPDIILHFTIKPNIYGSIAARLLNIPVINNVCGLGTIFLTNNLTSKIAIWMYKVAFRFPKNIFFQNEDDLKLFIEKKLVKKELCHLLPGSGIDLEKFKPAPNNKNEKFTFLLISRLIHDKGIVEYVEAVSRLKEKGIKAKFQLLGAKDTKHKRGIPSEIINGWIENDLVEYLGTTNNVIEYLNKADCVVLPSYREGAPRSLLEAASLAKPIIATDVPGCRQIVVDRHNGLLCRVKDSVDLAEKMEFMQNLGDAEREMMGYNGRKLVEEVFDEKKVVKIYQDQIQKITGKS
jgi:glycosyltransferase involved in cell wall biosynthesis